jgi:hypothetical protein
VIAVDRLQSRLLSRLLSRPLSRPFEAGPRGLERIARVVARGSLVGASQQGDPRRRAQLDEPLQERGAHRGTQPPQARPGPQLDRRPVRQHVAHRDDEVAKKELASDIDVEGLLAAAATEAGQQPDLVASEVDREGREQLGHFLRMALGEQLAGEALEIFVGGALGIRGPARVSYHAPLTRKRPGPRKHAMLHAFAPPIRAAAARQAIDPGTPLEMLASLLENYPDEFLLNPVLSLITLAAPGFFAGLSEQGARALVSRSQVPEGVLELLSGRDDGYIRIDITTHPQAAPSTVLRLLAEPSRHTHLIKPQPVLTALAAALGAQEHPSLPAALERLALHRSTRVRVYAAANRSTPAHALGRLALDESGKVRAAVATNPAAPWQLHEQILRKGEPRQLALMARCRGSRPETLWHLGKDDRVYLRCLVAENPASPRELLALLATDASRLVRRSVTWNLRLPDDLRDLLASEAGAGLTPAAASPR